MTTTDPRKGAPRIALPHGHLLLIGTGAFGVSALPTWIMTLRQICNWTVRVCLTHSAERLVSRDALTAASRNPVAGPAWDTAVGPVPHQELAQWADLVIVVPATTTFLAKTAHCIPDSLALSVVVSTPAPVVLAPSLPDRVVDRPSMRRTMQLLAEDGYHVVPPQPGISVHSGLPSNGGLAGLTTVLRTAADAMTAAGPTTPTAMITDPVTTTHGDAP